MREGVERRRGREGEKGEEWREGEREGWEIVF